MRIERRSPKGAGSRNVGEDHSALAFELFIPLQKASVSSTLGTEMHSSSAITTSMPSFELWRCVAPSRHCVVTVALGLLVLCLVASYRGASLPKAHLCEELARFGRRLVMLQLKVVSKSIA